MDRFVKVITTGVRCVVHLLLFQQRSQHSFYKGCKKRATLVGPKARRRGVFKPTHCLLSKNVHLSFMDPPCPNLSSMAMVPHTLHLEKKPAGVVGL